MIAQGTSSTAPQHAVAVMRISGDLPIPWLKQVQRLLRIVCHGPFLPVLVETGTDGVFALPQRLRLGDSLSASALGLFTVVLERLNNCAANPDDEKVWLFPLDSTTAALLAESLSACTSDVCSSRIFTTEGDPERALETKFLRELVLLVLFARSVAPVLSGLLEGYATSSEHRDLRHYFQFVSTIFPGAAVPLAVDGGVCSLLHLESRSRASAEGSQQAIGDDDIRGTIEDIVTTITEEFGEFALRRYDECDNGKDAASSPTSSGGVAVGCASHLRERPAKDIRLVMHALDELSSSRLQASECEEECPISSKDERNRLHWLEPDAGSLVRDLTWDVVNSASLLAREVIVSDSTDPPRTDGVRFGVVCKVASTSTDLFFIERERRTSRRPSSATVTSRQRSPGSLLQADRLPTYAWDASSAPSGSKDIAVVNSSVVTVSYCGIWAVSEFTLQTSPLSTSAASLPTPLMYGIAIVTRSARRWYLCTTNQQHKEMMLGKITSIVAGDGTTSVASMPTLFSSNFAPLLGGQSGTTFAAPLESANSVFEQAAKRSPTALLCTCATSSTLIGKVAGSIGLRRIYCAKKFQHATSWRNDANRDEGKLWAESWRAFDPRREFSRQQLPPQFMIDDAFNADFSSIATYPATLVVPTLAKRDVLKLAAQRRVNGRLEALTYYFHRSGGCIVRCSQPTTMRETFSRWTSGVVGAPAVEPPSLVQLYREAIASKTVETIDLRDKLAAIANVFKGGGYSSTSEFCGMENIHAVRKGFAQVCDLLHKNATSEAARRRQCPPQQPNQQDQSASSTTASPAPGPLLHGASLDGSEALATDAQSLCASSTVSEASSSVLRTKWLDMIHVLVQTSLIVARKVAGVTDIISAAGCVQTLPPRTVTPIGVVRSFEESTDALRASAQRPETCAAGDDAVEEQCNKRNARIVVVHCSDGWDRTSQVCATSQLVLDPYFRTIEGFCVLVDKDFVSFGHPFLLRSDHSGGTSTQAAPVFLQFLDAARHLVRVYPNNFQFTEDFLLFVADCYILGIAGNFASNCDKERHDGELHQSTLSLWQIVQLVLGDDADATDQQDELNGDGESMTASDPFLLKMKSPSPLINETYSHKWNLQSGCGNGTLTMGELSPLLMHLWDSFFLRYSPFLAAPQDQAERHRAAMTASLHCSTSPSRRCRGHQPVDGMMKHLDSDGIGDAVEQTTSSLQQSRQLRSSGSSTPTAVAGVAIPRSSSYSSTSAPASPGKRKTPTNPSRLPSDVELPPLDSGSFMAPPRNASVASLASPSHGGGSGARRPPRAPSSIMNQFLLADDD